MAPKVPNAAFTDVANNEVVMSKQLITSKPSVFLLLVWPRLVNAKWVSPPPHEGCTDMSNDETATIASPPPPGRSDFCITLTSLDWVQQR